MAIPSRRRVLRIWVVAVVGEDFPTYWRHGIVAVASRLLNDAARQRPMPNGSHHVLTDPEFCDGALVRKRRASDHPAYGLVKRLLQPHLPQGERLVSGEMRSGPLERLFSFHAAF